VTLAWVQVSPERYQTTGSFAPCLCGGTSIEKAIAVTRPPAGTCPGGRGAGHLSENEKIQQYDDWDRNADQPEQYTFHATFPLAVPQEAALWEGNGPR